MIQQSTIVDVIISHKLDLDLNSHRFNIFNLIRAILCFQLHMKTWKVSNRVYLIFLLGYVVFVIVV